MFAVDVIQEGLKTPPVHRTYNDIGFVLSE